MDGSVLILDYRVVPATTTVYAKLGVTVIGVSVEVTVPVTEASLSARAASQSRTLWDETDLVAVVSAYFAALATRVSIS